MAKPSVKKVTTKLKDSLVVPGVKKVTTPKTRSTKVKQKVTVTKKTTSSRKPIKDRKILVKNSDAVVILPPSASLRLLEKVNLYKIWYQETLPLQVTSSARFFGYLFIGLGTIFAASSHLMHAELPPSVAALVCSTGNCQEVVNEALPAGSPVIRFANELPSEITADKDFALEVENTDTFSVYLTNLKTGEKTELKPTSEASAFKFRVVVDGLASGDYQIEAIVDVNEIQYVFTSSIFTYQSLTSSVEPDFKVLDVSESVEPLTTGETEEVLTANNDENEESLSLEDPESEEMITLDKVVLVPDKTERPPVSIAVENKAESSSLVVTTGDFLPTRVDIYSRISGTEPEIYLGQAYLVQSKWYFSLSAVNLPKSNQQLFAKFTVDGVTKKTEAVTLSFQNGERPLTNASDDLLIKKRKVDLALLALDLTNDDRLTYYSNNAATLIDSETEAQFVSQAVLEEINAKLDLEAANINTLFFHYGVAYQGSKLFLLDLAKQQIDNYATLLANQLTVNSADRILAPAIETVISSRFNKLMEVVKTNEDSFATETNDLINQDLDNDGITDYDELTNFKTDPNYPDSDDDSITDGVEVLLLANPLAADLQKYPELSQQEYRTFSSELLAIKRAKSLIVQTSPTTPKQIEYSVEGQGIPNTFVYLLDNANDTVGIIKTNSAGAFFYTIDKAKLANDSSIKAAMIDQNGTVVVTSNEYHYNKQKNQLVATVSELMLGEEELSTRLTSFNILTGSIALVALGFILLLLAQSIRTRRRSIVLKNLDFAGSQ